MMLKLRSEVNFSLTVGHRYGTLVYIIIFLLGYGASSHHVSAAVAEDRDVRSAKEPSNTSLPRSKLRTSKVIRKPTLKTTNKTKKNAQLGQARRNKPRFVVFGTEGTICCEQPEYEVQLGRSYLSNHSECPHWEISDDMRKSVIIFLPHLRILFDYLLGKGVRIVFFSPINYDQNMAVVIPKLLESFWGSEKYEELKSQGQFHMYSGKDKTSKDYSTNPYSREIRYFKDMEKIRRDKESLSNAILVDGYSEESHPDQQPFIFVRTFYPGTDRDSTRLNSVYYVLGLFKTYFENEKYRNLPMRAAFKEILPVDFGLDESLPKSVQRLLRWKEDHPFVYEMTNLGLSAVREEVPNATLYKWSGPLWGGNK